MPNFSLRLRELRKSKNLTQQKLADYLQTSKSSINMYERGEREPGLEMIEAIADFFNVDLNYLLGQSDIANKALIQKSKDEKEIEKIIENTINDLESADGLMFDGKPANEEEIKQIKSAMRLGLAMAKEKAREKFTPKKYRNK